MRKYVLVLCCIFSATFVMAELDYNNLRDEQVVVDYEDVMNSRGDYYKTQVNGTLSNGASVWFLIDLSTATENLYINYEIEASSGMFNTFLFENPTVISSGTLSGSIVSYNRTRVKTPAASAHIYGTDGVIALNGQQLFFGIHHANSVAKNTVTWVLEKGTAYVLYVDNTATFLQRIQIRLTFFNK